MKKENVKVYSDPIHEERTKKELAIAQIALQTVLEVWQELDLIPVTDIFQLIINPSKCYEDAVNKTVEVPIQPGKYQISKDIWIKSLSIPLPNQLYLVCKAARQLSYCGIPELWNVEGDKVVLNASESGNLIDSQSLYASNPDKIALINDIQKSCELLNSINERLKGQYLPFNEGVYNLEIQPNRNNIIEINPTFEFLKRIVQS